MVKTTKVMSDQGIEFIVRLVEAGDPYGLEMKLVLEGESVVEFYDTRYPFCYEFVGTRRDAIAAGATCLGQFVSRYNVSTLLEGMAYRSGICLQGGVPAWNIDGDALRLAFHNLRLWEYPEDQYANNPIGDSPICKQEGWMLAEVDGTGMFEIQKDDASDRFPDDYKATAFVRRRADYGADLHSRAVREHEHYRAELVHYRNATEERNELAFRNNTSMSLLYAARNALAQMLTVKELSPDPMSPPPFHEPHSSSDLLDTISHHLKEFRGFTVIMGGENHGDTYVGHSKSHDWKQAVLEVCSDMRNCDRTEMVVVDVFQGSDIYSYPDAILGAEVRYDDSGKARFLTPTECANEDTFASALALVYHELKNDGQGLTDVDSRVRNYVTHNPSMRMRLAGCDIELFMEWAENRIHELLRTT